MKDHKRIKYLTNVDDLLDDGVENQSDLKQESWPSSVTTSAEHRSATDPFAIQLAEATMAEKIEHASPRVRHWAWVLLAWPPLIAWLLFVYSIITEPVPPELANAIVYETGKPYEPDKTIDWIFCGVALIPALYWPYLLLRNRK